MIPLNIASDTCNCGVFDAVRKRNPWIRDLLTLPSGYVPVVSTGLRFADRLGSWKVRWGIGRMKYWISPGLYAVGSPTPESPVLVSANYKMSFDVLRSSVDGLDAWILILDTNGINVWCAAGKGTFGTDELVRRIEEVRLGECVSHRKLILPQLGAPGISAHEVMRRSGFKVVYGPVRAQEIKRFIANGYVADENMRRVTFSMFDRSVLIPLELAASVWYAFLIALAFAVLSGFDGIHFGFGRLMTEGLKNGIVFLGGWLTGVAAVPLLLPWLPFRTFSLKGIAAAAIYMAVLLLVGAASIDTGKDVLSFSAWFAVVAGLSGYLAMNFTGATPYTSLSGVRKEVKRFLPVEIALFAAGSVILVILQFI